jgi:hypothetical protein
MTTITKAATYFDNQGYIKNEGITIITNGDTISIGRSEYPKDELIIDSSKITGAAGWYLTW